MKKKTAVILVNLGTPDSPSVKDVRKYLKQFLLDGRVIDYPWLPRQLLVRGLIAPFRASSSAKLYKRLWTNEGSPLKTYGLSVAQKLNEMLDAEVMLAMRYQSPSIPDVLAKVKKQNFTRIVIFPMFPQYASATSGSVHQEVMRLVSEWESIPEINLVHAYYNHPGLINTFAENARKSEYKNYDHYVFSFHGVPKRHLLRADVNNFCLKTENCCNKITTCNAMCYSAQCHATARGIAHTLNIMPDQYTIAFQSRLGPEEWTQPYTSEVLDDLAKSGRKKVLVFSPAFVADCLETTIEIGYEYKEDFLENGGEKLDLVPSLNDDMAWVQTIKDIVLPYLD